MVKIACLFAFGTEEIEGLTPVDVLRRSGAVCDIIGVGAKEVIGSHNIIIKADKTLDEVDFSSYDGIVIPGGMPGATNIAKEEKIIFAIKDFIEKGKLVASICASPAVVLAQNRLVDNRKLTCYPAEEFINTIKKHCEYYDFDVLVDNNLITANGPKSAMQFSIEIVKALSLPIKI